MVSIMRGEELNLLQHHSWMTQLSNTAGPVGILNAAAVFHLSAQHQLVPYSSQEMRVGLQRGLEKPNRWKMKRNVAWTSEEVIRTRERTGRHKWLLCWRNSLSLKEQNCSYCWWKRVCCWTLLTFHSQGLFFIFSLSVESFPERDHESTLHSYRTFLKTVTIFVGYVWGANS